MIDVFVQGSTSHDRIRSLCLIAGALLFLGLGGCATNPVTGDQNFVMFGEDTELEMGRTNHPKIIAEYGRYDDEQLQTYVQSVGEKLASVSHRKDLVYRFTVLDSPVINAFALPGGYVYITRGLMAYLNSEAELAAVLGHEIGHVTARHGVRQQSAAQAANIGYTLGSILIPELRNAGSQNIFNMLGGALLSGYGREHELESDRLGAEYLARAGYDPHAMIDVITVLKNQEIFAAAEAKKQGREYQGYHGLFASHPDNDTRLQGVVAAADKYKVTDGKIDRTAYLDHIAGMTFGDSEEQGIRSENHFYHLAMGFAVDFPEKWHINNNPDSLQAVAPDGKAVVEMGAADLNRKLTPEQFIKQRLKITTIRSGQSFNSHGLEGYTGITLAQDKTIRVAVVYLKDKAYIFFGGAESNTLFSSYDQAFINTIKSLHSLREDEIKLAQELKIQILRVGKNDNYASWAKQSRISNSPIEQLRLLNGDYPNGELQSGQLAKQVR
ncbi:MULTISPECIES: M48 family metalloprotease [Methylophaga]|uniref:M48 family metalloprotease n=1 Tax=Methylophaga TaxID=40222 RepID=UPI002353A01B|nr:MULTISPECIES: M48 family metalloprotease [Methylophaga]